MKPRLRDWIWGVLLLMVMCTSGSEVIAQVPKRQFFTGILVDMTCATDPQRNVDKLRSEHSRKCLLMPVCAESGYALLTDQDEVFQFDTASTALASKLIQRNSNRESWRVVIDGVLQGKLLVVKTIKFRNGQ